MAAYLAKHIGHIAIDDIGKLNDVIRFVEAVVVCVLTTWLSLVDDSVLEPVSLASA